MRYAAFTLLFLCIFAVIPTASAQVNVDTPTQVNVDMIPENPGPNTSVAVSLTSFATNINTANITWRVGGVSKQSGKGSKSFTFTTGDINTTTTLDITIYTEEGETVTKTF